MSSVQQLLTDHLDIWTAADTAKKTGRGRSSGNAASVYGIKKLRELILELAVRGKLVPQDAKDEPASELLKRIQVEKARLITEGKIKKDKPLLPITENEHSYKLPQGWQWVRLAEITSIRGGSTPSMAKSEYWGGDILWVSPKDMHDGVIVDSELKITEKALIESNLELVPVGSILIVGRSGILKRKLPAQITAVPCTVNQDIKAVTPIKPLNDRYLQLIFWGNQREILIRDVKQGTTVQSLVYESLFSRPFSLPPAEEQHRIVAKVDELMALCDQLETQHTNAAEAHEKLVSHLLGTLTQSQSVEDFSANWQRIAMHFDTLFTTEASIDALKQTLLQLAVMGKLVPQDANDESASELLKRIQAEKVRMIADGKIKKDKPLQPITDDEIPFELPQGWGWVRLGDISSTVQYGYTDSANYQSRDVLFLRITDIQDGAVNWTTVPGCSISLSDFNSYALGNNDLVIARTGGTIGKSYLVTGLDQKAVFASYLIKIGNLSSTSAEYKKVFFGSILYWRQLIASSMGTGQPNVNGTALKNLIFSLPPLVEQHRIVAKIDELMALCDQLKSRITSANQLQQKLANVLVE